MAQIIIVGGTGRTGRLAIEQLTRNGDSAVAIIRNAGKRTEIEKLGATVAVLDLETSRVDAFAQAFAGADAIIFAAGTREDEDNVDDVDRDGPIKAARAAEQAGVRRFVHISAMGSRTGIPDELGPKWQAYYDAKRGGDAFIRGSKLDWTVIEPGELTEEPPTGRIEIGDKLGRLGQITRADVAAIAIAAVHEPKSIGKSWEVLNGDTPIAEALAQ